MGFLSKIFESGRVKVAGHTADSVGKVWKELTKQNENDDAFAIARKAVMFRPKKYQETYLMLLENHERTYKAMDVKYSAYLYVGMVLLSEAGHESASNAENEEIKKRLAAHGVT